MGNNVIDSVRWYANGSLIRRVDKYTIEMTGSKEPVYAVGLEADGPIAFRQKPGHYTIEFDYHPETGRPEIDWENLGQFTLTQQHQDGQRFQYLFCEVANVGGSEGDSEGTHTSKITIYARTRKVL